MAAQRKEYITPDEFRETRASVTAYWIESRIAEHPEACCTMGDGRNCRILIRADFFVGLLDEECRAHGERAAALKEQAAKTGRAA